MYNIYTYNKKTQFHSRNQTWQTRLEKALKDKRLVFTPEELTLARAQLEHTMLRPHNDGCLNIAQKKAL